MSIIQTVCDFVYLYPLFMSFVWMIGALIFYFRLERKKDTPPEISVEPFFSILVPCHNEDEQVGETISHLVTLDYPNYEIILIDDGSTDGTAAKIHKLCEEHDNVRGVYLRKNQGKASALNIGCLVSRGELILTIDADALLDKQCLKWMAWHFEKFPRTGAITGNPRVINRTTLLGKIQIGEYSTIIGFIKRAQRILGKVLTVSGVIAAFRRQALLSVGFWSDDMITEDIDITWKLEKKFWDVRYEPRAVCWIFVPETLRGLWRQRVRWAQGGVEVLKKHDDIWQDWKQRRLWPIFTESACSILWVMAFWTLIILWAEQTFFGVPMPVRLLPPIPPMWTGSILALVCLMQFTLSICIDSQYDKRMFKYLFWIIWYPFVYWMVNAFAVIIAVPKALMKRKGTRAVWVSPDRGLEKIKSAEGK
ncbi:MAG: poly-beta-1,6 N-acetyl-D-glucosamine synthase [Nitrospiraceae bacterium]|nr:MAG: poly-beta-1,6 N-acetyl-D-glucosamine synthase [Nitrospiraceae bacterium]